MNRIRHSALNRLWENLLKLLGDNGVSSGVGLAALGAGVVDGVGEGLLDALGGLLLDLVGDCVVCQIRYGRVESRQEGKG